MNRATIDYKNYLLQDIIIIQGRGLVQLYCHFHMHNIFETYKYFFYFQIFYSVFLCFNVDALYYNMIVNKTKFPINEINLTSKYLDFLLGTQKNTRKNAYLTKSNCYAIRINHFFLFLI